MHFDITTIVVEAVINGLVGLAIWFAIQRTVEQVDKLQIKIDDLENRRLGNIERAGTAAQEKIEASRSEFIARIGALERVAVLEEKCLHRHESLASTLSEFRGAVIDLARVETNMGNTAAFLNEVNNRVISLKEDVDRMMGEQNGRR